MLITVARGIVKALAVLALVAVTAWAVVAIKAFHYPEVDAWADTDAYYTLHSGGGVGAVNRVEQWLPPGKPLLVSVPDDELQADPYGSVCGDPALNVICVAPHPESTRGEARNLGRIARERGWQSVTVISQRSHMTRARLLMERCYDGEIRMFPRDVNRGIIGSARVLVYESGAMAKAWLVAEC